MAEAANKKKLPKGGRKGGSLFPKMNLERALVYSKKLVVKTHTGPQPDKTILPGVFGNAGAKGKVRASALKQFGLLEGGAAAYQATQLAKDIDAAVADDKPPLLQRAFRAPKLFNQIFETFHGDTVSKAKIEQRARGLEVHPDSADECAQLFMDSAVTAGLGTVNGDSITVAKAANIEAPAVVPIEGEETDEAKGAEEPEITEKGDEGAAAPVAAAQSSSAQEQRQLSTPNKSGVNVNLTVDPSSDPDKLEKQLKLLKQYGLI